jgi:hypothetical protein
MNLPPLPRLALLLLEGLPLAAGAADWQSLLGNSPFGQATAAATGATGDLEFRGVVQEEGVYLVNLYNPTTKTAQWLAVNGKVPGLEVQAYDANSDKVQILQAGRALTLPLKQARVALIAAAAAPAKVAAGDDANAGGDDQEARRAQIRDMIRARLQNGPDGGPSPFMRNLPPEAQAMIEEFRRRRADGGANGVQSIQVQGQNQAQGQNQSQAQNYGQRNRRGQP